MNILIATQYFWPESFRVNDLAQGLKERGHEVEVLAGMPNYPAGSLYPGYGWFRPGRERYGDIGIVRAPLVTRGTSRNWRLALNYLSFATSASIVGPLRCRSNVDAVLAYEPSPVTVGLPALVMGRLRRAPVLLWIQDLWPDTLEAVGVRPDTFAARAAARVSDFIHRRCDLLLAQSRVYAPRLAARGIDPRRIEYLPNWAEGDFRPSDASARPPDPMAGVDGFRIVFAGNMGSAQAFETTLEAATRLRELKAIKWVLIGEGNMREWVEAEVARRGLSDTVLLLGWKAPESMPAYFAHADALLVTLRADPIFSLTVPSKVQTYLACGKPILAALNGEGAAILEHSGAALVTSAGDGAALAENALRLASMACEERSRMGRAGRAHYEGNFERAGLLTRLESYLERAKAEHARTYPRR
jgi:glycosyltransferase involved in cell wall biosynthesis